MRKAWIENDQIRDIAIGDPAGLYHPDVAKLYDTDVPDHAKNGDGWVNGQVVPRPEPEIPEPVTPEIPAPVFPTVPVVGFKLLFTSAERVAIQAARVADPIIDDFWRILDDQRLSEVNLGSLAVQEGLEYLESKQYLSEDRKNEILTGKPR
jgi:hypothetical protein